MGRLPGRAESLPGLDVRGDGGYVVVPPSRHAAGARYRWVAGAATIAPAPAWLLARPREAVRGRAAPPPPLVAAPSYGRRALADELERLRAAPAGTRNATLNHSAFRLAQLIGGRELGLEEAHDALAQVARERGLTQREIARTLSSAFTAGLAAPRARRAPSCNRDHRWLAPGRE